MKKIVTSLLMLTVVSCTASKQATVITDKNDTTPLNIIMVVGDGMGPAVTTAYRYYKDDPLTPEIEETVFDRHLVGMATTYPARVSGYVTDSAASATALSTGFKSYNGAIGLDERKNAQETVLEWAKKQGKKTGVVVTSQVNHATPASYMAHNESRKNYDLIANSYIDDGIKVDLLLGGGWKYFIREDRNLVEEFQKAGFQYIDNYAALDTLESNKPVLGLFDKVGLPWALDDIDNHRLATLTRAATKHLENPNGFFMLIEASQVDWAGHSNDINSSMAEMDDLAKTMEYLESYVAKNPNTLVILTADHSTGGLTVAANGKYIWDPSVLKKVTESTYAIAGKLAKTDITNDTVSKLLGFDLTDDEVMALQQAKYDGSEQLVAYFALAQEAQKAKRKPSIEKGLYKALNRVLDGRTNTGWTSGGHTAIDVQVYAIGEQSEQFHGAIDNTDIAKKIFKLLGKPGY